MKDLYCCKDCNVRAYPSDKYSLYTCPVCGKEMKKVERADKCGRTNR